MNRVFLSKKGFTLLEVLIATVVLAISLSGVYLLIKTNITNAGYVHNKLELYKAGSELLYKLYLSREEIETTGYYRNSDTYEGIMFKIDKKALGFMNIYEYTIYVKKDGTEVAYHFYK